MKSITIIIDETKNKLAQDINSSGLPMVVIEMILKDLYQQSQQLAKQELESDKKQLEEESKKMSEEELEEITNNFVDSSCNS